MDEKKNEVCRSIAPWVAVERSRHVFFVRGAPSPGRGTNAGQTGSVPNIKITTIKSKQARGAVEQPARSFDRRTHRRL
jgi:hypothetical protein